MSENEETPATATMQVLFVHGMGRSPLSGWPLLRDLKRAGLHTGTFGYLAATEDASRIIARLSARMVQLAAQGDYILIGHSLGGVLLRAALAALPKHVRRPRHLFLLASPIGPARLAQQLGNNLIYRLLTRDCGQLLASAQRMEGIGPASVPVTGFAGIRGLPSGWGPFRREPNDGIVSLSEVSAAWITDQVRVPLIHALMPSSREIAAAIIARIGPDRSLMPA